MRYLWIVILVLFDGAWLGVTALNIKDCITERDIDCLEPFALLCIVFNFGGLFIASFIQWLNYKAQQLP